MKHINKREIKFIAIASMLITIFTMGIVNAANFSELESKGKGAINSTISLGYRSLTDNNNTYCIQRNMTLKSAKKEYKVDKYVEINGKMATVYESPSDSGSKVYSDYNAKVAYILNKQQGYGTAKNHTQAQKALYYYANSWVKALFGTDETYLYGNNDGVSISGNTVYNEAEEYAKNLGNTTGNTNVQFQDQTPSKNKLNKLDPGDGYYRIGPFRWQFSGTINSISVKADGKQATDIRFIKYEGKEPKIINIKNIPSGRDFYIDIKNAQDITSINVNVKLSQNVAVKNAKIWFLRSAKYQNLIHVVPSEAPAEGNLEQNIDYLVNQAAVKIGLQKKDDRGEKKPLVNVGFKFRAQVQSYDCINSHYHSVWHPEYTIDEVTYPGYLEEWYTYDYEWRTHIMYIDNNNKWKEISKNSAKEFKTDKNGIIQNGSIGFQQRYIQYDSRYSGYYVSDKYADNPQITAIEESNPYYGYSPEIGKEYAIDSIYDTKTLVNHQKYVKLSGYVWLDENQGKTSIKNDLYDNGVEKGINDIKVYLKDSSGNIIKSTTTSELGIYDEIVGGEYRFVDVDLDELQAGKYHVEFEYGGMKYQSVASKLNVANGSKAIDTNSRNILDNKFTSVDGNGTQNLNINGVNVNYNENKNHVSTINNFSGDNVYARTDEAGYNLYSEFKSTMEEIKNINLGLFEKEHVDYALTKDLYDVRVEVNGKSHIYRYATVRYNKEGDIDSESSWNLGVKFQRNTGTYSRAIYKADAEFTTENKDRELKVYTTYKIALKNESHYLGRINNIVDYCDNRMKLIHAGTTVNDQDVISNELNFEQVSFDNNEYSKYRIDTNAVIEPTQVKFVYIQFEINREAVLSLVNDGEMLNNMAEINSYTTFKNENIQTPVAVVDKDSVPGNMVVRQMNTYEDDTDAATSLKLELKNARAITGTVFVDSTGKDSNTVYKNEERKGNGTFDNGETTLKDVEVKLMDTETNQVTKVYDETSKTFVDAVTKTDENGNFEFVGFIPGNYEVVYIWGDKTYKVQYYKGTIYNENRTTVTQGNQYWYRGNTEGYSDDIISADTRATDALDNYKIRENIDKEMEKVITNTLEKEISNAYEEGYNAEGKNITITKMESATPEMSISVEYTTTITDGTVEQVRFAVRNIDFGIVERPKQQLELTKRVSGYKLTLANGQILADVEISEDGKMTGTKTSTVYMGPTANSIGLLKTEIDNELIEGAKLEVRYTITVENVGEIDYTSDKYYYYGNASDAEKVKVSPVQILDYVDRRLSVVDDKWKEKDLNGTFVKDYNVSEKDNTDYLNNIKLYVTEELSKTYLAPSEIAKVDLSTSKLLTSTDNNEFNNKTEVIGVKKNTGFITGTPVKVTFAEQYFDVADSEKITIIPSTGENKDYVLPIVIGITAITILGVGIILIKRFIINK